MNIYQFMDENWFTTILLSFPVFLIAATIVCGISKLINRCLRTINVLFRGWPPKHCDADGDSIVDAVVSRIKREIAEAVESKKEDGK